jgi:peptide/nickel transport system substrate-binding protein
MVRQARTSFFEKKEAKKLLSLGRMRVKTLSLLLALLGLPAFAGNNCGTIVVPSGVGISSSADITSFNPLLVTSEYNQQAANLMYLGLIWIDGATQQIDWPRSLASAISTPDNGTTYNVTLRPWHWSDGAAVTSADVAYTFWLIKAYGTNYAAYGAGGMPDSIQSLNIISPTEFQVVLTHQVNPDWFIYNGLPQLEPLPQHSWSKYTPDQIYQQQSTPAFFNVVDGPLKLQRLDTGLDAIFVPNPAWEGPPLHVSRLIFKFINGDGAALQAFEAGNVDMSNIPDALWNAVQKLPNVNIVKLPLQFSYNEIMLNFRNPDVAFFRDVRVRQAMADSINEPEMVQVIDHGAGETIYAPVMPGMSGFLTPAMRAGNYPISYDPAKAIDLLRQAGYTRGPDGIMQKDGKKLSFEYLQLPDDALIAQIALMSQSYFAKIGIQMKIHQVEFNQMLALINSHSSTSWQTAGLAETVGGYPTGEELFATGGALNAGGYSDPKMDQIIADSTDKPGRDGLYEYETYASEQQPVIFQEREQLALAVRPGLQGAANFVDAAGTYYPDQLSCTTR